jgi:hypothetical protein
MSGSDAQDDELSHKPIPPLEEFSEKSHAITENPYAKLRKIGPHDYCLIVINSTANAIFQLLGA